MIERVILVDRHDREIGTAGKLEAHVRPLLHRACSVFILNTRGELLLQQRMADKYHSPSLWTNTACGHPRPGEDVEAAARRRLNEEMGIDAALTECGHFIYRARIDRGMTEHELDHVFVGFSDAQPRPDAREVGAWRWSAVADVARELVYSPQSFTACFEPAFRLVQPLVRQRALFENPESSRTPSRR